MPAAPSGNRPISGCYTGRHAPCTEGARRTRRAGRNAGGYGASGIVDYVAGYIFDGDALLVSEDGANLLARSTPIVFLVSGKYWVNNHAHILKFEHMTIQRFVEFYLERIKLDDYITGTAQLKLNQKALNSIPIPIPKSVEVQAQVVESRSRKKPNASPASTSGSAPRWRR